MPKRRTYRRRRRYRPYRGGFASNYRAISKYTNWETIWKAIKDIKELINVEKKFFDVTGNTSGGSAGQITSLSNIAEGNDYNNRDGLSVLAQSTFFRGIWRSAGTETTSTIVRLILFCDNDQRGTDPAVTDILETASYLSPLNHVQNKRFTIIWDTSFEVEPVGSGKITKIDKRYRKYNAHIKYSSTAGADASAYEGNLYLLDITSTPAVAAPTVNWYHRLRYTDN